MTGHTFSRRSALLTFLGLAGAPALAEEPPPPEPGRGIDRSDYSAPSVIKSRDITGFLVSFGLYRRWTAKGSHEFRFQVKKDAAGVLTASEEISAVSRPADAKLLAALQAVIEKWNLAQLNGINTINPSLPPEYPPCSLQVDYASGEVLRFTKDNYSEAQWAEEFYDIFAAWFAEKGEEALYPPKETSPLTTLVIEFTEGDRCTVYDAGGGATHLLSKQVFDTRAQKWKGIEDADIPLPQGYFARVTAIIAATGLLRNYEFSHLYGKNHEAGYYGTGNKTIADGEPDSDSLNLRLYMKYASKKELMIETKKPSEIEAMRPIIKQLVDYHESLFKKSPRTKPGKSTQAKRKKTP